MIIMRTDATQEQIAHVVQRVENLGLRAHLSTGVERTVIGAIGDGRPVDRDQFTFLEGVDRVVPITRPFKLTSREFRPENSLVAINGLRFGGEEVLIIGGPCSVEDRSQILETAWAVREAGGHMLRGGAFKPRTSPYSFQGLGLKGLELLAEARQATGLPVVTEVMTAEQIPLVAHYADMRQKPILLKRGMSATIEELLMSAEYILSHGNRRVVLCERGIRTYETATRNTTDINAIPVLKSQTHLPVILDPSHSTGNWAYVSAIARAGIAAGADGLIVEVHPNPADALSDGGQSLKPERFAEMVQQVKAIAEAVGRRIAPQPVIVQ